MDLQRNCAACCGVGFSKQTQEKCFTVCFTDWFIGGIAMESGKREMKTERKSGSGEERKAEPASGSSQKFRTKQGHRFEFDLIRCLAMLCIFLFHFNSIAGTSGIQYSRLYRYAGRNLTLGQQGVTLFFILSGCTSVLSIRSILRKQGAAENRNGSSMAFRKAALSYYGKRLLALMPLFWCAYFAAFLLFRAPGGDVFSFRYLLTLIGFDGYLAMSGVPTQYLVGEWFLGAILILYLLFPLLYELIRRFPRITAAVILILYILYTELYPFSRMKETDVLLRIPEFCFGIYYMLYREAALEKLSGLVSRFLKGGQAESAAETAMSTGQIPEDSRTDLPERAAGAADRFRRRVQAFSPSEPLVCGLAAGLSFIVFILCVLIPSPLDNMYSVLIQGIASFLMLAWLGRAWNNSSFRLLSAVKRPVTALAGISYSIFLVHHFIMDWVIPAYSGSILTAVTWLRLFLYLFILSLIAAILLRFAAAGAVEGVKKTFRH